MNLAIHSYDSADILLRYVETYFSEFPNRNIEPFEAGLKEPFLHHMGRIVIGELQSSEALIVFQTPNLNAEPNQIGKFITYLLNTKSKGSFFQHLQHKGFISESKSTVMYKMHNAYLFTIEISITELGLAEVTEVIKIIYDYLGILRNISVEEYQMQWDNFISIEEVNFDMMISTSRYLYVE